MASIPLELGDTVLVNGTTFVLHKIVQAIGEDSKIEFKPLDSPCTYTHSHTRGFCGNTNCRES